MDKPASTPRQGKQLGVFISDDINDKVRYMAWFNRKKLTKQVSDIFDDAIKAFEKKNGAITAAQIEQAKEK